MAKSRPQRWAEAAANLRAALDTIDTQNVEHYADELASIREEYEQWHADLPENLENSPMAEKLEAVVDLDLDYIGSAITEAIDEARSRVEDAEGIDLPLGFGRD
jgi:hypothetical protein